MDMAGLRLSSLPRSLLVHGAYKPSAPIRLAISVPPPHHVLLVTPSRNALLEALQSEDDHALLNTHTSNVTLFYPPTPKHLLTLLAMLRTHHLSSLPPFPPNVTLDRPPAILILLEPSAYFFPVQQEHTLSSYLLLITHALLAVEHLSSSLPPTHGDPEPSSSPVRLVVFDTRLDHLQLPVLLTPPRNPFDRGDDSDDLPKPESVLAFAQKYFEFSGTLQSIEPDPQASAVVSSRVEE